MKTIIEIEHIKTWTKDGVVHYRTYAILDNQDEAIGYGQFKVGNNVEVWFNEEWDYLQMKLPTKLTVKTAVLGSITTAGTVHKLKEGK